MKKFAFITLLVLLFTLAFTSLAFANGEQVGSCPPTFDLMMLHDHDGEHMHHHIGNDFDQNGDGWLCMKHVGFGVDLNNHVHIDNNLPLD